jgi:putative addiction module killer protein
MEPTPREIVEYEDEDGNSPYSKWIAGLRDRKGRATIQVRINRLIVGNFGDCKPVGEGVKELVVDFGPGYRVYFGEDGRKVVLLGGGDKSTQPTDITRCRRRWSDYNA